MAFKGYEVDIRVNGNIRVKGWVRVFTPSKSLTFGQLCYLNSSGEMDTTVNTAESSSTGLLGIALGSGTGDMEFLMFGELTAGTWLSAGLKLWVGGTAGIVTSTAPTGSGVIRRIVGYTTSTSAVFFCPDNTWIVNT